MERFENPIVLITRPRLSADRFVAQLRRVAGAFEAVICPAFEFEAIPFDPPQFGAAIFTSREGVAHAPSGGGRTAWCVGDATAQAAAAAGYQPISAQGSAEDLVAMILARRPDDRLLHIRGEIVRADITTQLKNGGLVCDEVVAYRKAIGGPSKLAITALQSGIKGILPLFSAETVSILRDWEEPFQGFVAVAISDDVARLASMLGPCEVIISDRPDMQSMAVACSRLIA